MGPSECKYCGCEEIATKTDSEIVFRCWSSYVVEDDYWTISNNCGVRCAMQVVELRWRVEQDIEFMKAREANFVTALRSRLRTLNERVQRAVEVLEGANQIMMTLEDDEDVSFVVESQTVSHAIEILEGEEDDETD